MKISRCSDDPRMTIVIFQCTFRGMERPYVVFTANVITIFTLFVAIWLQVMNDLGTQNESWVAKFHLWNIVLCTINII